MSRGAPERRPMVDVWHASLLRRRVPDCAGTPLADAPPMATAMVRYARRLESHGRRRPRRGAFAFVVGVLATGCNNDDARSPWSIETDTPPRSPIDEDSGSSAPRMDAGVASDSNAALENDCALRGQQCFGRACCAGAGSCSEAPYENATTWACGGVAAGGSDADCVAATEPAGCQWTTLSGCQSYGRIQDFCAPGTTLHELKRCDGSCFLPDALYQQYEVRSCDAVPRPGIPACGAAGASWAAVLCCTK